MQMTKNEMEEAIKASRNLVFMTGAGVSVPSGIPDYRSIDGVYAATGLKAPEYLLSRRAMLQDTEAFYAFVKKIYKPESRPNVIHNQMTKLSQEKSVTVITQNIDGLHRLAGSPDVIEFHGDLTHCYCERCKGMVGSEVFLASYVHENCGGILRPNIVLYDEGIDYGNMFRSEQALMKADTIVIVGTSFQVYPFAGLIDYANPRAKVYAINKEPISVSGLSGAYVGDAVDVFELL